jgi:hypothetical protein
LSRSTFAAGVINVIFLEQFAIMNKLRGKCFLFDSEFQNLFAAHPELNQYILTRADAVNISKIRKGLEGLLHQYLIRQAKREFL